MMNSEKSIIYICNECGWKGVEEELELDNVESCMGDDKIEICPVCGSMNIVQQKNVQMMK